MKLYFEYASEKIQFDVCFRNRKTMEIRVEPPDMITVIAPLSTPEYIIIEKTKSKANWILKKIRGYKENEIKKITNEYKTGEIFMYLGEKYLLQIVAYTNNEGKNKKPVVTLEPSKICIKAYSEQKEIVKSALETWYKKRAKEIVQERVMYFQRYFTKEPRSIKVKVQKKIWGSCTGRDDLLFNWKIVMATPDAIDYVIVHEMCHMVEKNHSKKFWKLVSSIMPDYKERKQRLDLIANY